LPPLGGVTYVSELPVSPFTVSWLTLVKEFQVRKVGLVVSAVVLLAVLGTTAARGILALAPRDVSSECQSLIDPNRAVTVNSIQIDSDHRAVIAGYVYLGGAWAVKTEKDGRIAWHIDFSSKSVQGPASGSMFNDSASLPNGVTALCGHVENQSPAQSPNFLLFIGKNGQELFKREFLPQDDDVLISSISKCVAWNDGILTIGSFGKRGPYGPAAPNGAYFWIRFTDANGTLSWERDVPRIVGLDLENSMRLVEDGSVVFSLTDNKASQIIKISKNGEILTSETLAGAYILVRSDRVSAPLQLIPAAPDMNWELVSVSNKLKITHREQIHKKLDMFVRSAWFVGGSGLVVFGESLRHLTRSWATIRTVSGDMKTIEDIDASFVKKTFTVDAVDYDKTLKQFTVAYRVLDPSKNGWTRQTFIEQLTDQNFGGG
jgi:hypothetical protein